MCVDGAADMGKSSARTHGQGKCGVLQVFPGHLSPRSLLVYLLSVLVLTFAKFFNT